MAAARVAALAGAAWLSGCAGSSKGGGDAPNSGLEALAGGGGAPPPVKLEVLHPGDQGKDDINLTDVLDRIPARRGAERAATPDAEAPQAEAAPVEPAKPAVKAVAPEDPEKKIARLADELRTALTERAGVRGKFQEAATLAGLEPVRAGAGEGSSGLSPGQRRSLEAFRAVVRAVTSGSAASGDPRQVADVLVSAASGLDDAQGIHVRRASLCSRVLGYGRYEVIGGSTFVAGRPARFIVYTELDRFAHRQAKAGDPGRAELGADVDGEAPLAVELSQELSLWHDADGSAQWRVPEQAVVEVSRNRRRDFYLVQQVELPSNLSVGKYNLKVLVKDRVSGGQDEASIPIVIVADPGVALSPGGGSR